ncbi:TIGR02611 family protein [Corynebacterium pelargi]|uniref:Transmembrane protein (PGPGW) n=1 Tax=Corynebacterium pelargi TaxID=1471400 RepID=A0A410WAS2_9CORY|nr:TIGR02611 family protein [Corynebacterium pelargi]QAU53061.1 Putative transmembrane protein (PGPGW) [Corynebacterium pelargi]GGG75125.1 membrane protein [Corynebacterium pelargi]
MGSMRDAVAERVERLERNHQALKQRRYGFLVRPLVLTLGTLIVIVGLITIPFPGPGWLTVFIGIGVLSLEVHWAARLLGWGVTSYDRFSTWYQPQPKKVRYSIISGTVLAAWITVLGITWVGWKMGMFPALDPVLASTP